MVARHSHSGTLMPMGSRGSTSLLFTAHSLFSRRGRRPCHLQPLVRPGRVLRYRNGGSLSPFGRKHFKIQEHGLFVRTVVRSVANVAGFEEAVSRSIHRRFVRLNVGQLAIRNAANARSDVMVLADIAGRIVGDLSDAKFVPAIEISEVARDEAL